MFRQQTNPKSLEGFSRSNSAHARRSIIPDETSNHQNNTAYDIGSQLPIYPPPIADWGSYDDHEPPVELNYPSEPIKRDLEWEDLKDAFIEQLTNNHDYQKRQFKIKSTLDEKETGIEIFVSKDDRQEGQ